MAVTIVTLTGFPAIFDQFQRYLDVSEPETPRIVVTSRGVSLRLEVPNRWKMAAGIEPFVFARNANLGIEAAGRDDVLLVNDDVQIRYPGTVQILSERMRYSSRIGIISPQIIGGHGGNTLQRRDVDAFSRTDLMVSEKRLMFACVLLRREMIDEIGLLDERFTGYGCEDDDYCLRAQRAGWQLAVTSAAVVRHGYGALNATASFGRCPHCGGTGMSEEFDRSAQRMRELFCEKWGRLP